MRTVVVTGIAGALGRRVAAQLAAERGGVRIVGIDSRPHPALGSGVDYHQIDLAGADEAATVTEALASCCAEADAVIHLAWRLPDAGSERGTGPVAEANRLALQRVLAAAGGARSLVHLSSATVYGAWADNRIPLTEDAPLRPNPQFAFATGKADAERTVADWADLHPEVAVAVLRPAVTLGTPERPLYLALGGTRMPAAGDDGARPVQFLHIEDLAAAVVLASQRGLRGVYNVAPDGGIPVQVARALAGGLAKLTLPEGLARPLNAWGWDRWRRGVPREARPYTSHPWVVAPDRLKGAGWVPEYTSEEALVATDHRPHFDDLPPGRRQNLTMLVAGGGVAGVVAALGGVLAVRARRREP